MSEAYDTVSEFIHISLNYKVRPSNPLIMCYTFYDKNYKKELDNRFKYYEVNVEKFAKLWYDKDMKSAREKPLLTMIGIKNKEDVFIYDITPEEEEKYIQNTEKNIARREGLKEGLAEGELNAKINIAKKLLKGNYTIDEIVRLTELSKDQVKNLL